MAATQDPIRRKPTPAKLDATFMPEYAQKAVLNAESEVQAEEEWKDKCLGRGTVGEVWLQQRLSDGGKNKLRVVKTIQKSICHHRRLGAVNNLSQKRYHELFVQSLGWHENEDFLFLNMEYIPHGSLSRHMESPLSEFESQQIASQILKGLDVMHENGIAHRNLKPNNILVVSPGPDWLVKIGDFGVGGYVKDSLSSQTPDKILKWLAPECLGLIDGQDDLVTEFGADMWSFGEVIFCLLTAESPFKDLNALKSYVEGAVVFPTKALHAIGISHHGTSFLSRLMATHPEDRISTQAALQTHWLAPENRGSDEPEETVAAYVSKLGSMGNLDSEKEAVVDSTLEAITTGGLPATDDKEAVPFDGIEAIQHHSAEQAPEVVETEYEQASDVSADRMPQFHGHIRLDASELASITSLAFSPDGLLFAVGDYLGQVIIGNSLTGRGIIEFGEKSGQVSAVEFSQDLKTVWSATPDRSVRIWDHEKGKRQRRIGFSIGAWEWFKGIMIPSLKLQAMAFSTDGHLLARANTDGTVRVFESKTGAVRAHLEGKKDKITALEFSLGQSDLIAAATVKGHIGIWDLKTGEIKHLDTPSPLPSPIRCIAFSPGARLLAAGSDDGSIMLWDLKHKDLLRHRKHHSSKVRAITFSPDGWFVISGCEANALEIFDWASMQVYATCSFSESPRQINSFAISPDSRLLAVGFSVPKPKDIYPGGQVCLLDLETIQKGSKLYL